MMTFDKFKGIQSEREIALREKSKVEVLLESCDRFISKKEMLRAGSHGMDCPELEEELQEIDFTADDLRALIFAKANTDYNRRAAERLGIYTGRLLQTLNETFYIDGKGAMFDYLFLSAKNVNSLIVKNFKGNYICNGVGHGGKAELVIGLNIEGEAPFSGIGTGGEAELIVCKNIKGDKAFCSNAFYPANIDTLIVKDVQGKEILTCQNGLYKRVYYEDISLDADTIAYMKKEALKVLPKADASKILGIAESINETNTEEKIKEIKAIYEQIKNVR